MDNGIVVCSSGGMDSFLVAAKAKDHFKNIRLFHLDYGQKTARKEFEVVSAQSEFLNAKLSFFKIGGLFELYNECELLEGVEGEEKTYVPFRNTTLASLAAGLAETLGYDAIGLGIHFDEDYPDTTDAYSVELCRLFRVASNNRIGVYTPLALTPKEKIVKQCFAFGLPLALTWSCYFSNDKPCGRCTSCIKRTEAFSDAKKEDPL